MDPPAQADLDALRAELEAQITFGSDSRRKAVAQAFVRPLVVEVPGTIRPTYLVRGGNPTDLAEEPSQTAPTGTSRAVTDLVVLGCHYTNTPLAEKALVKGIVDGLAIRLARSNAVLWAGDGDR